MNTLLSNKHARLLLLVFLVILFIFYANKINLANADIGRHIKNGEILLKENKILGSNFYSYTNPDFPAINHHWAYGAIIYLVWATTGFFGVSLFNIIIYLLTFLLIFKIAEKKSNYRLAILFSILALPLIVYRKEVRPEVISYLLFSIYYFLLIKYKSQEINYKILLTSLFLLQILWVNTHIFFIFGIVLVLFFTIDSYLNYREKTNNLIKLFLVVVLASLVNPYFLSGLLEPFMIFRDYGYLLAENVSIFFMQKRTFSWFYIYVEALFILGMISFFVKGNFRQNILNILLFVVFGGLALNKIRGITLLGFLLVPILSENFKETYWKLNPRKREILRYIMLILFSLAVLISLASLNDPGKGLGLLDGVQDSSNFLVENYIQGNIFNNYDLGGYLIYNLFPDKMVFVDNRPEAYPVEFFKEVYIPMQEDNEVWERYREEYGINVIYFYRHDLTPWAQNFLIERIKDPLWIPVYVDEYVIIYLEDNEKNKEVIDEYRLPKEMFVFG
ncbi:MAG: hypothetical protein Q8P81_02795 [Nanoarchaeota archaeon]|nr:hypothetical protein [Nanoarchaeota archaeon]